MREAARWAGGPVPGGGLRGERRRAPSAGFHRRRPRGPRGHGTRTAEEPGL